MLSTGDRVQAIRSKQRLKKLKEENGILFYKPHERQDLFHKAGEYARRYVRTGNRFGKSLMGCAEDIAWCLGERPWYDKSDPARYLGIPKHPVKGLVVCQTWEKVEEVFTNMEGGENRGKIWQLCPKNKLVSYSKGHTGIDKIVIRSIHGSGDLANSFIHFTTVKTYQNNPLNAESSDYDFIHIDEPIPQPMWIALSRGLVDRGGFAWFTCTPLEQMWINRMFIPPSQMRETLDAPIYNKEKSTFVVTGSMKDNPHNTARSIDLFLQDMGSNMDEVECRLHGVPIALSGLIYKAFDRNKHVYSSTPYGWENKHTPPKDWTIRVYIDPHPKTPHAILYFATGPLGHIKIFSEFFAHPPVSILCEEIREKTDGYFVQHIGIDPLALSPHPNDGSCMIDDFYANNIYPEPAVKDLARGLLAGQRAWMWEDDKGFPLVQVNDECTQFLFEIDDYTWAAGKDKPRMDCSDHMMENFYRAVVEGLDYVPKPVEGKSAFIGYEPIKYSLTLPDVSTDLSDLMLHEDGI